MANTMGTSSAGFKMSGLVSGLDTEALVKQMSMATKNKINKNQQKLDLLSWKQESYRAVIDKISKFKNTYLNMLEPKTCLKSNSLFSAYKAISSNDKITAVGSSMSGGKKYNISQIEQLASAAKVETSAGTKIASGVSLDFSTAKDGEDYEVQLIVDGLKKDVKFKGGADAATTGANFLEALNKEFRTVDNSGNTTFEFTLSDKNVLDVKVPKSDTIAHSFIIDATANNGNGLKAIGVNNEVSNRININSKLKDINFATPLKGGSFTFTINDEKFTFDRETTIAEVMDKVNKSDAGVKLTFNSLSQKFQMETEQSGSGSSISIKQTNGNLLSAMFGADTIAESDSISSLSLMSKDVTGTNITSSDFSAHKNMSINVTVNGVTKTIGLWGYDSNGVKNEYGDKTDSETGKSSKGITTAIKTMNAEMKKAFGADAPEFAYEEVKNGDKTEYKISVKGAAGDVIKISETMADKDGNILENSATGEKAAEGSLELLKALGFEKPADGKEITNKLDGTLLFKDVYKDAVGSTVKVGGSTLEITETTTLKDFNDKFGSDASIDFDTGIITLKAGMTATKNVNGSEVPNDDLIKNIFGTNASEIAGFTSSGTQSKEYSFRGQNAILTVNGVKITNNSNQIKLDGTTINIENATDDMIGADKTIDVDITTQRDTKDAFDAVVKFVADYNKMIDELNTEVNTSRPTDNGRLSGTKYEPLTEEQREEMTDKEIEKWEEKAKTGLLHNDKDIRAFLDGIRRAMSKTTHDKFSLYDMGITVSNSYKENGKLEIDEDKLRAAFEKNPEQIQELFAGEDGIMASVENAVENAIGTKGGQYGSLVRIAGIKNTSTQSKNNISNQISTYSDMINNLKDKYEREQERYWKQFTNLEKVMNQYNTQASWLAEQFGGMR